MKSNFIALLFALCLFGCGRQAINTDGARCYAASELALFSRDVTPETPKPIVEPTKPKPVQCQCNGTHYVNDRSSGRLRRVPCPCGAACKCIGIVGAEADKRPEVICFTAVWCKPCKPILAEIEACKSELSFVLKADSDDDRRPEWVKSLPTFYWCVGGNQWRKFVVSKVTPWPGVDAFDKMIRDSFPKQAAPLQTAYGVSAGKFPIRATVTQIKQLLSAKGLSLPYGLKVNCPTGGLVASVSQAGQDVAIEFDETALPAVSFNGKVRSARMNEQRGLVVIDGLPDITFEVTP